MSKNTIKKESSVDKVPSSTTKKKETSDKDDNEASAKDLPPGKEIITKPTEHDVLLGRGGGTNNHSGNVKFRQLVNEHKLRYLAASKVDKPKVARDVVKIWRGFTPPGRFLTRTGDVIKKGAGSVKAEGNCWLDVGDRKAREKASQCLRERTPDVKPIIEQMQFRENAQAMAAQQQQQQQAGGGGMYPGMYSFPGSAASVGSGGHSIGTNMSGEAIDNAFNVEHFQVHAANSFQHFSSNGTFASGHSGHSGGGNSYGAHSASGQLHHRHMDPLSMASIATDERTITSGDTIISAAGSTWTDFTPPQVDGNGQGMTPQQQMQQQQQQYMNHHQMNQHRGGGGGAGPTPHYQPHHPMPRPSRPSQTSNTNVTFQGDADLPAGFPVAAVRPRNITPPTPSSSNNNNMSPLDSQSYIPSRHHHQSSYQSVGGSSGGSLPTGNNMYNTTTTSNNSQNFQPEFTNHHTAGNNMDNMYNTTTTNNGGSDFSVAMQQSYGTTGTNGQKSWVSGFNSVDDSQQSLFFSVDGSQGPMSVNRAMMMNSGGASTNMSSMTSSSSTANNDNSNNNNNNNTMPPPSSDPTSTSTTSFAPFDSTNTSMLSGTAGGLPSTFNTIHEGEQQDIQHYQQHQQYQQQQQQQEQQHDHQVQFPPSPSPSPPPSEQQDESQQQYSPEQDTKPQKKKHNVGLNSHFNKSDSTNGNNRKSTVGSLATKSRQSQRSSRSRHSNYSADDLMSGVSLLSIDSGGNKTANTRQSLSNMSIMSEFSELSGDQLDLSVSNSILEKF
eukprot:CAMPEP_0195296524 /NCGR_PEP_ID=MMETSP0707-20130614/19663_1 /TAXON_ID=33640 /ORGANISM="Asterionellopsis glacialis, Strain CCMP134" /LENGTH=776 /DNA_ID=CAMNT_0040358057 /DNA_START=216 /DNA_END=2546 /DNA_ORIENTATION=-